MFYIDHLQIASFRNYQQQEARFHPYLNLISGENAQGKSNLLESIYYLSVHRSFRTNRDQELVNWNASNFLIKGDFVSENINYHIRIYYEYNGRLKISINNNPTKRYEKLQLFPVVIFNPEDLQIIRDSPSVRRRFLNLLLSRLKPQYLSDLKEYQRALMQRNRLLKERYHNRNIDALLEPWDQALIKSGSEIIHSRVALIKQLEKEAQLFFLKITNYGEKLSLFYNSSINYCSDLSETMRNYRLLLLEKRNDELRKKITTIGPHIDDLTISINDHDARYFSSQGQKRTAALALKIAEVNIIKKDINNYPIIILDDVFSEFDACRREHLLDFLRNNTGQCFISTAQRVDDIVENLQRDYMLINICQGQISNEKSKLGS